ncbi:MAG: SMC family ATPase [Oscillospiraceae bacterium]|nr:SMC family ATPase [Oscillospiraceae bacterium]
MRPICLKMTAFGSYADTVTVPFSDLKQGLYLVTGDTGAGKTTIFDAIVFALYGEASGSDRSSDMMHCDHVPKSVDTEVELRFLQDGKEYSVLRKLHFQKKQGTQNEYGSPKPSALLTEPDRGPTEGAVKVTQRCTELLGLNADQFRKIIMLAQGEFREFLNAGSDKKNEILGKLFDNSPYVRYQELLSGAQKELKRRRDDQRQALSHILENSLRLPDSVSAEARIGFMAEHPALLQNLKNLIAAEEADLSHLQEQRQQTQEQLQALDTRKGAAAAVNAELHDLEVKTKHLQELRMAEAAMTGRRLQYERFEIALHRVLPKAELFERADRALTAAKEEITALERRLSEQTEAVALALKQTEADGDAKQTLEAAERELLDIRAQLPRFQDLSSLLRSRQAALEAAEAAKRSREDAVARKTALESEEAGLRETLAGMEALDVTLLQRKEELQKLRERCEQLDGKGGLREQTQAVRELEDGLQREQLSLARAAQKAGESEERYHVLYHRFIDGQAAVLAADLADRIERDGEAECPVCHARRSREHIAGFAPHSADTPTQGAVEKARAEHVSLEKTRQEQDRKVSDLSIRIRSEKETILKLLPSLLPDCRDWNTLSSEGYLRSEIGKLTALVRQADQAYRDTLALQQQRTLCRARLDEISASLQETRTAIDSLSEAEQTQRAQVQSREAAAEELKRHLSYPDEAAARKRQTILEEQSKALSAAILAHQTALESARELRDHSRGSLTEKQITLQKLLEERSTAHDQMTEALQVSGFVSKDSLYDTLRPIRGMDGDTWLKNEQDALSGYREDCRHTADDVERLTVKLKNQTYTDLEALSLERDEVNGRLQQTLDAFTAAENYLENHRTVLWKAEQLIKALNNSEKAWRRIDRLGNLAIGTSGEGGKLSFDRYVMGAVFREILEMANRRMDIMSGGRYQLVHKVEADRRSAKAGLDISVLDVGTGQLRDSGSLSGGESFFTSLSLALGLSDVVQNHAGGKKLDTLFIDEGFGTLSDDVLDKALSVLGQLTEGDRLVGIISHVDKLRECIPEKILVRNGNRGSTLSLSLS